MTEFSEAERDPNVRASSPATALTFMKTNIGKPNLRC